MSTTFTQHLDSLPSTLKKKCVFLFISLQYFYHNDIANFASFSFLRAGGN